ncbi:conserved hypothetical protein [Beggiatoa sp. PS]|nr:conserved hypothetical protein [Beggiatoa sp. PS]
MTGSAEVATGDATVADVLTGKTFSNSGGTGISGTMTNNAAVTLTPSTTDLAIAAGYHNGSGIVSGDADLTATNIKSGVDIFGVTGSVVEATGDATAADVLTGKTFSNAGNAGVSGTMPTQTLSNANTTVNAGYYSGTNLVTVDSDLVAENIKSGVTIFGVLGTASGSGCSVALPKTGQTTSYAAGDDGDLQKGATLPTPRFTDNTDGTVTDNLTGLIWLKNANCFGEKNWMTAISDANGLASGSCGLSDGSSAGDWRLPNRIELTSLINLKYYYPALSNAAGTGQWTAGAFSAVQAGYYWSSTTYASSTASAWRVVLYYGSVSSYGKTTTYYVWPVRGSV